MIYTLLFLAFIGLVVFYYLHKYFLYFQTEGKKKSVSFLVSIKLIFSQLFHGIKKSSWVKSKNNNSWQVVTFKGLRNFFAMFFIIALLFAGLQLWIDNTANLNLTTSTILQIEKTQHVIKESLNFFKINFGFDLLIVFLLIALAGTLPIIEKYKLKKKYSTFNKFVSIILLFLTISTSFTFFGQRLGNYEKSVIGDLQRHKLEIIRDNKLLVTEANEIVEDAVVNEILTNPDIVEILLKKEEVSESINEEQEYIDSAISTELQVRFASRFKLKELVNIYKQRYDFESAFVEQEKEFVRSYQDINSGRDPYEDASNKRYSDIVERNSYLKSEDNITRSRTNNAKEAFAKARTAVNIKVTDPILDKYKEPIKKIIKKGYSKFFGEVLNSISDIPFFGELMDIVVHDNVENIIESKTDQIIDAIYKASPEEVMRNVKSLQNEVQVAIAADINQQQELKQLKNDISIFSSNVKNNFGQTMSSVKQSYYEIDLHLKKMKSASKWESYRQSFAIKTKRALANPSTSYPFPENVSVYDEFLTNWEKHCQSNKIQWFLNGEENIERHFYEFMKYESDYKAAWGFVIQQEGWFGAVEYYTRIQDYNATGKPYYLLKYYCAETGFDNIDVFYDEATNISVGDLCSPH